MDTQVYGRRCMNCINVYRLHTVKSGQKSVSDYKSCTDELISEYSTQNHWN